MPSIVQTLNILLSIYNATIAVLGTIGNLFCFIICTRKRLRLIPTFIFMSFMVITDTFALYEWNLNNFFLTFFGSAIGDFSEASCKMTSFLQFFSSQTSAYLLVNLKFLKSCFLNLNFKVAITLERLLSVKITNWRSSIYKPKHAVITALTIVFIIFSLNVHTLGSLQLPKQKANSSSVGLCYSTAIFKTWRIVSFGSCAYI
jgi:hypothetical protein